MNKQKALEITRRIPEKKTVMKTSCLPGMITVLIDEAADGVLHSYLNTFAGKDVDKRFSFKLANQECDPTQHERIGFNEKLPESLLIAQFLLFCGFSSDEAEKIMEDYDLQQYGYLSVSGLNATATRQLQLLAALKSESPVLICNDPFLPFSGRWREDFAKLFLTAVKDTDRIIVVTSLSFMPQAWKKADNINIIDVGKAAEKAKQKAEVEAAKQAALEEQIRLAEQAALEQLPQNNPDKESDENYIDTGIPDNFQFAYKTVNDFIFTPLANLSNTFRTYSGFIVPGAIVCIALMIGLIMYPNLKQSNIRIKKAAFNAQNNPPKPTQQTSAHNAVQAVPETDSEPTVSHFRDILPSTNSKTKLKKIIDNIDTGIQPIKVPSEELTIGHNLIPYMHNQECINQSNAVCHSPILTPSSWCELP